MDGKREDKITPVGSNSVELLPEEMSSDLKKFITGASAIGFLPPLDSTASLYKDPKKNGHVLTIKPLLSAGPGYSSVYNVIYMNNIPDIDWKVVGSDATKIKMDSIRKSVIIFCHEVLHALHHNAGKSSYTKMQTQKDSQYSWAEERYAIAGFKALLEPQQKLLGDKAIKNFSEHMMCEKLGFIKRTNAKDSLIFDVNWFVKL